jgi:hypothetical protein
MEKEKEIRLSNKKPLTLDNLLKIIDFLPNADEKPVWGVYKITYGNGDVFIGKGVNYQIVKDILDHSPLSESERIRKEASYRIEDLFDALSSNPPEKLEERAKYLRLLMRLTIIAF